jgi:hypothetical protein
MRQKINKFCEFDDVSGFIQELNSSVTSCDKARRGERTY